MDLRGKNIVVIDVETRASADDCRHCGQGRDAHGVSRLCPPGSPALYYEPLGWDNKAALGLSLGCIYWYANDRYTFFDRYTLEATMLRLVLEQPRIVSFNGWQFDGPFMFACLSEPLEEIWPGTVGPMWQNLWENGYDILAEIWKIDPDRKFERGLNSLDALSQANGLGAKEMDVATAPVLWRQGRYAEVATYNLGDVWRTKRLFEQVVETGQIVRGDGRPIMLPRPVLCS